MIPAGLRRRPQFMDLLHEIQTDPNKIRYPNRDAKRLRNGFVYSQFDEESNVEMLRQQLRVNEYQELHNLLRKAAMTEGVSYTGLVSSFNIGTPRGALYEFGATAPGQEETAARLETEAKAAELIQRAFREQRRQETISDITGQVFGTGASSSSAAAAEEIPKDIEAKKEKANWQTQQIITGRPDASGRRTFTIIKKYIGKERKVKRKPETLTIGDKDVETIKERIEDLMPEVSITNKIQEEEKRYKGEMGRGAGKKQIAYQTLLQYVNIEVVDADEYVPMREK